jgi:uncharacterized protein YidB (DUF937 family)
MGILGSVLGSVIGSRVGGPMGGALGGALGGGMGVGVGRGGFARGGFGRGGMMGGAMMGGGMGSPISKALMLLLAGKLASDYMGRRGGSGLPGGLAGGANGGGLAGMPGGGGLGGLIEQMRNRGHGQAVDSWVQPGPNQRLAPQQLAEALGPDTVDDLERQTGMPRDQLLAELADTLPDSVDQLTPDGRVPRDEDLVRD